MSGAPIEFVVKLYSEPDRTEWNTFLRGNTKNAAFLFHRDYLDYHRDRFSDYSLIITKNGKMAGLMPAHRIDSSTVASHNGLTYGGLALSRAATLHDSLVSFRSCLKHLYDEGIERLQYKHFPSFYNDLPCDEIDHALFLAGAELYRRDCAIVVQNKNGLPLRKGRKHQVSKARRFNFQIKEESSFAIFWNQVLIPRLEIKHGVKPVHSLEEIEKLAMKFPKSIRQFSIYVGDTIQGGVTIYETPSVAHCQYIAVTEQGQENGSLDLLCHWLIKERYSNKTYFDFGNCCEDQGRSLNRGLLRWKESFGGRTYRQDFYWIDTKNFSNLDQIV